MAKNPTSNYTNERVFECSVPAEVISAVDGYPYAVLFIMTGELTQWRANGDIYVWNPSTVKGQCRDIVASKYPIYIETVSGTETAKVVEDGKIVRREFPYTDYFPSVFESNDFPNPTGGRVSWYSRGYSLYVRATYNLNYKYVNDRTGDVYYEFSETGSLDAPRRMADKLTWHNTTPFDRTRNIDGISFHETATSSSVATEAVQFRKTRNEWDDYKNLGLPKSKYESEWKYTSGSSNAHGLTTTSPGKEVILYNGVVHDSSSETFGHLIPYCIGNYPDMFSTVDLFKSVNRHEYSGTYYIKTTREYTCSVVKSGNNPSFGSRADWIEYCRTLYTA